MSVFSLLRPQTIICVKLQHSQLMLNLYVEIFAGSSSCHAVAMHSLREYYYLNAWITQAVHFKKLIPYCWESVEFVKWQYHTSD